MKAKDIYLQSQALKEQGTSNTIALLLLSERPDILMLKLIALN